MRRVGWSSLLLILSGLVPALGLDLSRAHVTALDNGLTVAVLEDHTLPVVSVQMLYRAGARNEEVGRTGVAHYLEHMAFRATESFPDTEVVSAIYAVGGEWHGYTWIDQTTYFETVPREHLDLALRIEAERMQHLLIPESEVEAERGAVLSELHGYENDPSAVLLDAVVATSFSQHPYRNNTIGWVSDVERIEHSDLVDFHRRYYHPANAVLAVVGDVDPAEVDRGVRRHFSAAPAGPPSADLRTVEPEQKGERRIRIEGEGRVRRFAIAYKAPSVRSPDWPAFLLLQEILGGGEGVNFLHNEWGVEARPGTRLHGIVEGLSTWYPPAFYPYLFVISGSIPAQMSMPDLEEQIEKRLESLRTGAVEHTELDAARARLRRSLVFDVQTTEDAAHQLASYLGYETLPQLLDLPAAVDRVTEDDIQRLASTYLQQRRRTVGWFVPRDRSAEVMAGDLPGAVHKATGTAGEPVPAASRRSQTPATAAVSESAVARFLSSGLPVLFQRVTLSPTAYLRVLVPTKSLAFSGDASLHRPVWGWTSLDREILTVELESAVQGVKESLLAAEPRQPLAADEILDPSERLARAFEELLGIGKGSMDRRPGAVVLVGDLEEKESLALLERHFGQLEPAPRRSARPLSLSGRELESQVPAPKAQARLGYVVPAPLPGLGDALSWRVLLYILTHGYEGRLGKEAITRRGLVYYIDSRYHSDGRSAWIALSVGVDPPKLAAMRDLLVRSLAELERLPPTEAEIDEAKEHLVGRWRSAALSNEEISAKLVTEWIDRGRLTPEREFVTAVRAVTREDVLRAIPAFVSGAVVVVGVPE